MMKGSTTGQPGTNWLTRERTFQDLLPAWSGREWFGALALMLAVILAYLPVWNAGFVWDDQFYLVHNPHLIGLRGLKEIWTSSVADISPFVFTTFWVEHALWGLAPLPYHIVNVLTHGACAVAFWRVLLVLRVPGAWLGSALWALHPVNTESVAWVTELKNTESGLFFLFSILFFMRWLQRRANDGLADARWNYGLTLLFAALAMCTKSSTVILPGVLCLVAWWIEGRWHWRNLLKVAPVAALSVAMSALSVWTQSLMLATALDPIFIRSWPERLVTSGVAVWFYAGKLTWPYPLMAIYPRWQIDATKASSYLPLLAVIVTLFILWLRRESWARAPFFVFAYFLGALLPVLGLFDNYIFHYSLVFDHFLYLSSMAPMALAGACLVRLADAILPGRAVLQSGLAIVLLLGAGVLTWHRATNFRSEETLWADTAAKDPEHWPAHYNLATELAKQGRKEEAIREDQKTIELYPNYAEAHINLGLLILEKGRIDDALAEFHTALKINPKSGEAYNDIGTALLRRDKEDEALAAFQEAEKVEPALETAPLNYGRILLKRDQLDPAIASFERALIIDPNFPEAYADLGKAFLQVGQTDAAIEAFRRSLELAPDNADACNNLGLALVQKGQLNEGVIQYQRALEVDPKSGAAESNLGVALFQAGLKSEAMKHLRKALELDPNSDQANNNLGNALLAGGQLDDAIAQYQKALAINAKFNDAHRNLGLVFMTKGNREDAIAQFEEVLKNHPNDTVTQSLLAKAQAVPKQTPGGK